jgi:hypothetical protein
MPPLSLWETLALCALALWLIIRFGANLRAIQLRARQAPADWGAALWPIAWVVVFVIFLILVS